MWFNNTVTVTVRDRWMVVVHLLWTDGCGSFVIHHCWCMCRSWKMLEKVLNVDNAYGWCTKRWHVLKMYGSGKDVMHEMLQKVRQAIAIMLLQ